MILRLKYLYDYVDTFYITEQRYTHQGSRKEILYIEKNAVEFEPFKDKIRFLVDETKYEGDSWNQENGHRRFATPYILNENEGKSYICSFCDCDEIPDREKVVENKGLYDAASGGPAMLIQNLYYYNLNWYACEWKRAFFLNDISLKTMDVQAARNNQLYSPHSFICGWHLSYAFSIDEIVRKFESFAHKEFNLESFKNRENIYNNIKNGILYYNGSQLQRHKHVFPKDFLEFQKKTTDAQGVPNYVRAPCVAFFLRHFLERGTEVSAYQYAKYNEDILGHKSVIICFKTSTQIQNGWPLQRISYERFKERFDIYEIEKIEEMGDLIDSVGIDFFYTQTHGGPDIYQFHNKVIWKNCKTIKHCVFFTTTPESDFYISISSHLNKKNNTNIPVIPYIVELPETAADMRDELNIPRDATVFGRLGGMDEFNIPYVHDAIKQILDEDPNMYFIFLNTKVFYLHERITYLDCSLDPYYKAKFINTCDAMIHARQIGETFGLSIAEFSILNKPIFTSLEGDLEHVLILGEKGIYYNSKEELLDKFRNSKSLLSARDGWNCYSGFSAANVMKLWNKFIFTA